MPKKLFIIDRFREPRRERFSAGSWRPRTPQSLYQDNDAMKIVIAGAGAVGGYIGVLAQRHAFRSSPHTRGTGRGSYRGYSFFEQAMPFHL